MRLLLALSILLSTSIAKTETIEPDEIRMYLITCATSNSLGAVRMGDSPFASILRDVATQYADFARREWDVTDNDFASALKALQISVNDGSITWDTVIDIAQRCAESSDEALALTQDFVKGYNSAQE